MADGRPQVVDVRRVDPDPGITSAVGRHHSLNTAIADLVDNSIDAGAKHVLIRFAVRDGRAAGLLVIDDGGGMDATAIDDAMSYAHRREYDPTDLGHFGIGMKAASLSQAETLWVWSRRYGSPAVGRGLERSTLDTGPMVQTFATDDARARLDAVQGFVGGAASTIVEWRDVTGFLQTPDEDEQRAWLETTIEQLRKHLGLVLHRILEAHRIQIRIEELDETFGSGAPRVVTPLDPFGYANTGRSGYPRRLAIVLHEGATDATLHVWPHAPSTAEWLLGGQLPSETQGLYVYRHDRLLQAGGWGSLATPARDLAYARVAVDVDDVSAPHVRINPEKTGVVLDASFTQAWLSGECDEGGTFSTYLDDARGAAVTARSRHRRPVAVIEPRRGFAPVVLEAFEDNGTFVPDRGPVDVRWRGLTDDVVFRVDHEARTIWLNSRYRAALGGATGLTSEDAQVTKVLIHLLAADRAARMNSSQKSRLEVDAWNAVLLAAVQDAELNHARPPGRHAHPTRTEDDE